jgi:hypothetical protein
LKKSFLRFLSFFLLVSLWGIALQRTAVFECESTEISASSECVASELEEDIDQELSSYDSGGIPIGSLEGFSTGCGPLLGGDGQHLSAEILMCKIHQYQLFLQARFQLPPFYLLYQTLDGYLG